jgi:pimeloyl-ACP methyl ester carboxylesterase
MPMIPLNGLDVFYETHGRGDPVLLVHGLGSSTEDWEPQVDALARDFTVVTYDVRGHGRTGKPRGAYSVTQFAADAAALISRLGLAPVHVVGLSMGGMIAFQLAADHPELVRSLVIVNSGPEMVLRTFKERMGIAQRRLIVRLMGMRKMGEVLAVKLLPGPEHSTRRGVFADRWARNDRGAYLRALSALVGWSVTAKLPGIQQPVLVVTADQDYTPVAWKEWYTALMPNATLAVIPESRHMMPIERPQLFHDALLPFLAGAGTGRQGAGAGVR